MPDFTTITEAPEQKATAEQLARLGQRYRFARDYGRGQRILEVACGTGIGLQYLTNNVPAHVIGGELDSKNLTIAKKVAPSDRYIALIRLDAQILPFRAASFDTVVCFEAIYYFPEPERFITEVARVLRPEGLLVLGTVNCAWQDFHPSPYTHRYFNSRELFRLLQPHFTSIELYGGFPIPKASARTKILSLIKQVAMSAHLIPGSLAARAYLKRIFFGPLQPFRRRSQTTLFLLKTSSDSR